MTALYAFLEYDEPLPVVVVADDVVVVVDVEVVDVVVVVTFAIYTLK